MKRLSIIIPIYNAEKYLRNCVDSILKQTYHEFELLLIDDGSTDLSAKICDEYAEQDQRVKVHHKTNGGCTSARNLGLDLATGDYFAFVDADDVLDQQFYEILIYNLEKYNADVSACSFTNEYGDITPKISQPKYNVQFFDNKRDSLISLTREKNSIEGYVWNKVWKREAIGKEKFSEEVSIVDDAYFTWFTILKNVDTSVYVDLPMYRYRIIQSSITRNSPTGKYFKALLAFERMIKSSETLQLESCREDLIRQYLYWNLITCDKVLNCDSPVINDFKKIKKNISNYYQYRHMLNRNSRIKLFAIRYSKRLYSLILLYKSRK